MNSFLRTFWLSFAAMTLAVFAALHAWWSYQYAHWPARPSFPLTSEKYVAIYGAVGYTPHYLYRYGIFGMRKRLQESDVLLMGSSHVELGLSAARLSQELSQTTGRTIRVYNLGTGFGESLPFDRKVLASNQISHKAAIVDLYIPWGEKLSPRGEAVESSSTLQAYFVVGHLWLEAAADWWLDPWLPNLRFEPGKPAIVPVRLLKALTIRRWDTGDMVDLWKPEIGGIYENSPPGWKDPFFQDDLPIHNDHHHAVFSPKLKAGLTERDIRAIYTLIPYDRDSFDKIAPIAQPYVVIPPTNLTLIDTMHLNASSRDIATDALFEGIKKGGYLSLWNLGSTP